MPKATIRDEHDVVLGEAVTNEWPELAEEVGSEIQQIFLTGSRPDSLTVVFDGMSMTEWEALPEYERQVLQEYGADE